ncbi:MAG: hypothetical protein RIB58_10480 [Phycisphaerales bacterium]
MPTPSTAALRESLLIVREDDASLNALRRAAEAEWDVHDVDLRRREQPVPLMQHFGDVCRFPEWYRGGSWDSMNDMLGPAPEDMGVERLLLWVNATTVEQELLEQMLGVLSCTLKFRRGVLTHPRDVEYPSDFDRYRMAIVCVVRFEQNDRPGMAAEVQAFGGAALHRVGEDGLTVLGELASERG